MKRLSVIGMMLLTISAAFAHANTVRLTEYLDRGVFAVRNGNNVFVSWRLLATEPQDVGFNVYRVSNGQTTKLNSAVLTNGTNFTDNSATLTRANRYYVTTVRNGVESPTDGDYTLPANPPNQHTIIPLRPGSRNPIHFVWVGDFNGDGKFDFLVDRLCWEENCHQKLEAYLQDGTFLWEIDLGPGSRNKNNISPGPSTISVGHWDGVTVYDIDGCGRAEVILRAGNGVILGDGTVFNTGSSNANAQSILVIDGETGKLKASARIPEDYISFGPLAAQLGIGHFDGRNPSLVASMKNRIGGSGSSFNMMVAMYNYNSSGQFGMRWRWLRGNNNCADAHQIRIADADLDGRDEIHHIGCVLNGDGTVKYSLGSEGVNHGDRYYIGRFNKEDSFLMGYGTQQGSGAGGLMEYTYNAATGAMIWKRHAGAAGADIQRANVGDIDPNSPGYEVWHFDGHYSNKGVPLGSGAGGSCGNGAGCLYPVLRIWWEGNVGSQSLNDGKIEGWDHVNKRNYRIFTPNSSAFGWPQWSERGTALFYGDILGDWREEVVMAGNDYSSLIIFSTTHPTDHRIFTLSQDKAYRSCMTIKGYQQSHMTEFYLGYGMDFPVTPPTLEYFKTPGGTTQINAPAISKSGTVGSVRIAVRGQKLNVTAAAGTELQIRIFDMRGKTAARFTTNGTNHFSLSNLPAGRYVAEVKERSKQVEKFAFVLN